MACSPKQWDHSFSVWTLKARFGSYRSLRSLHPLISLILGCSIVNLEVMATVLTNLQNRGQVSTSVAVVRRGPDCHELLVKHELIPFLYKLVRPSDKFQRIEVVELLSDAPAE